MKKWYDSTTKSQKAFLSFLCICVIGFGAVSGILPILILGILLLAILIYCALGSSKFK